MARKEAKRLAEGNGQDVESLPEVSEQAIRELAQVFKLLSDETRLRILFYLALSENRELHVTDLCKRLGQSQPAVSHHLALCVFPVSSNHAARASTISTACAPTTSASSCSHCSRPPARCPGTRNIGSTISS